MSKNIINIIVCLLFTSILMSGCSWFQKSEPVTTVPQLSRIDQIDSFNTERACTQALEVINNNPYSQDFFESAFSQLVNQCESRKSPENADIIWEYFIGPLKVSGKVPPDLAINTWNYYFSNDFVSLPSISTVNQNCHWLIEIKKNIEKEYQLKIKGFEITQQGSPDAHFLNAMYVFNTMWAACNDTE